MCRNFPTISLESGLARDGGGFLLHSQERLLLWCSTQRIFCIGASLHALHTNTDTYFVFRAFSFSRDLCWFSDEDGGWRHEYLYQYNLVGINSSTSSGT